MSTVPAPVSLRRPVGADVQAAGELHAWSWRVTYGPLLSDGERLRLTTAERVRLWTRILGAPQPRENTWFAELDGRIVGLVFSGPAHDGDATPEVGEIHAIHVEPGLHGRGIGRLLLEAAQADLSDAGFARATLWVMRENHEARRFYEGRGWRPDGCEKRGRMGDFDDLPVVDEVRYGRSLAIHS